MGIWADIKARREAKKQQEIDNEIERIEQHKGKRLSEKGVEKVTKRVEDRRAKRLRNTLIAILGSLGLAVGGHALLSDGNQVNQQNNKNNIEMENENAQLLHAGKFHMIYTMLHQTTIVFLLFF